MLWLLFFFLLLVFCFLFLLPISLQLNRCEYMYSLWLYCFRSLIIGLLSKFDLFYVFGVMICVYFFSFFFIDYTLVVTVGILKPIAVWYLLKIFRLVIENCIGFYSIGIVWKFMISVTSDYMFFFVFFLNRVHAMVE